MGDLKEELAKKPGADVVLSDGSIARVTMLRGGDPELIGQFASSLSDRTLSLIQGSLGDKNELSRRLAPSESKRVLAALREGSIVGLAFYERLDAKRAEANVIIADAFQGKGLGSILLGELA